MSFFSFKDEPTLSLVFDIRDTSVTIAAARLEKGKKPELVSCQNFKIESQDQSDHEKYLVSMFKTLDNGAMSLKKNLIKTGNKEEIGKHFFFVGSPWSVSQSKTIRILKDKPFEIDQKFLERIISNEEDNERREIEKSQNTTNWSLLEEKVVQSKLNGYKADVIFGKKTNDLEIELFTSFIPKDIKNRLSFLGSTRSKRHNSSNLNSCVLSSYSFFRDLYSDKNNFIYVDMGDFVTDAYVVIDDIIQATVSIPLGRKEIVRSAATKTKTPKDVLLSSLHISHRGDHILPTGKTKGVINEDVKSWLEKLNKSISETCAEINIPREMFIIIKDEMTSILIKEIENSKDDNRFDILSKNTEVLGVEENVLNDFITNGRVYKNEPYIKMDLVFLNKVIN